MLPNDEAIVTMFSMCHPLLLLLLGGSSTYDFPPFDAAVCNIQSTGIQSVSGKQAHAFPAAQEMCPTHSSFPMLLRRLLLTLCSKREGGPSFTQEQEYVLLSLFDSQLSPRGKDTFDCN